MNRATCPALRVRWAGPAVLSVLIALAATPRTVTAAVATSAPPPFPVAAAVTATSAATQLCWAEALAYAEAWKAYIDALQNYYNSLPGGTEQEIMDAARRLDEAASRVWDAGWKLIFCLGKYIIF